MSGERRRWDLSGNSRGYEAVPQVRQDKRTRGRSGLNCVEHAALRPLSEGIPFLGFVIYPDRHRLKRRKGVYYQRRLRKLAAAYAAGEITL